MPSFPSILTINFFVCYFFKNNKATQKMSSQRIIIILYE